MLAYIVRRTVYALPILVFQSYVRFNDRTERHRIGGALASIEYNPRFKKFLAGQPFSSDSATEVIVTENFLNRFSARAIAERTRRGGRQGGRGPFTPASLEFHLVFSRKKRLIRMGRSRSTRFG